MLTGEAVTVAGLLSAVPPALIIVGGTVGTVWAIKWAFGSDHHVDACQSDCGTVVSGYGFSAPQWTDSANGGSPGWSVSGVTWPDGVSGDSVINELFFDGAGGAEGIGWGGHTSPTAAPAPGWGSWMSAPSGATGLKAMCMYDGSGDVVAVWGDSLDECGVPATQEEHALHTVVTCTGGGTEEATSALFYETDTSLPDLPMPSCPDGEYALSVVIYEPTYDSATGDELSTGPEVYSWTASWGDDGPPTQLHDCLQRAFTDTPCASTPTKLIDGIWEACTDIDCRGYPTPMPAEGDTGTSATGSDGDSYGCSYGSITEAPLGYCNGAADPGTGATTTSDDPRLPAVIDHLTGDNPYNLPATETDVVLAAEDCLDRADASGLFGSGENPCSTMPIFFPGSENAAATAVDWDGLAVGNYTGDRAAHPEWFELTHTATDGGAWYDSSRADDPAVVGAGIPASDCYGDTGDGLDCDEFPFNSTTENGSLNGGISAVHLIAQGPNRSEGRKLAHFYTRCGVTTDEPSGGSSDFLVVPMVFAGAPATFSVCQH